MIHPPNEDLCHKLKCNGVFICIIMLIYLIAVCSYDYGLVSIMLLYAQCFLCVFLKKNYNNFLHLSDVHVYLLLGSFSMQTSTICAS